MPCHSAGGTMLNRCALVGLLVFCFAKDAFPEVCSLRCYHCGWSRERRNYRTRNLDEDKDLPYPVAERHMAKNDAEQAELSNPPVRDQLEKYCKKQTCSVRNDACATWSFKSTNPINITYMCVGNPKRLSGCYRQKIENKDYLEVEVCLCNEDLCNKAKTIRAFQTFSTLLSLLVAFVQHHV